MFTLSTVFIRSVNLFRGQEVRAKSPHTSVWGRLRLAGKNPDLETLVMENLKREIAAGSISIEDLIKIAMALPETSARNLRGMVEEHILANPDIHEKAFLSSVKYLNDPTGSYVITCGFARHKETFYPRVAAAESLLSRIMSQSTDSLLKIAIGKTLGLAPPRHLLTGYEHHSHWHN